MQALLAPFILLLAAQLGEAPAFTPDAAAVQPEPAAPAAAVAAPAAAPAAAPLSLEQVQPPPSAPPASAPPEAAPAQHSVLAAAPKPSDLMRQLMQTPPDSQLVGTSLTLGDAVRAARSRQDQTARAKAYWNLSAAAGDYYLALAEDAELAALRQSVAGPSAAWDAHGRDAQARIEVTRRAAQGAQWQLHQLLGLAPGSPLPLPADMPHCGRYSAEYDEIFATRPDPLARQLSELLPLRHEELRVDAQAVLDAAARRDELTRRGAAVDGVELLNAQELLSLKRRAFLAAAREYNQEIAAYTELAAPAEVAPERLVAMMIRTSAPADRLPWQSSQVRQAMATEAPAEADQAKAPAESATFAPESYREVRRPLQRLLDGDREHSIVSRIRKLRDRMIE